ncbi:MAG: hypothetical protein ABII10_02205 [Candidatus Paceibacterota bacterium]
MKRILLIITGLILGLWRLVPSVEAKVFTPESELFESELDGAWEFGEVAETEFAGEENSYLLFSLIDQEVLLNTSAEPSFLVENSLVEEFEIDRERDVWLELVYQPWSQETEAGFDDPVLVVFVNGVLVLKKSVAQICCKQQTEKIYLGVLSGKQSLAIFAGETGDLLKPSGVILQSVKVSGQSSVVANRVVGGEVENVVVNNNSPITELVKPTKEPDVVISEVNKPTEGQVLGAEDENSDGELSDWQKQLKELVHRGWFVWLAWVSLAGVIWLMIRNKDLKVVKNKKERRG